MNNVASLIHDRFDYLYVHLFSVHGNRRLIQYQAGSGTRSKEPGRIHIVAWMTLRGLFPGWRVKDRPRWLTMLKTMNAIVLRHFHRKIPIRNFVSPFVWRQTVGMLDIQSDKRNAFTEDDRFIFEAVADNIATAIHNADLYRSEQWRRQVADGLREVAGLISADAEVDDVLEAILSELERNLLWIFPRSGCWRMMILSGCMS